MTYYNTNNTNTNNMKINKHNHQTTDKPLVRPSNIVPRHPSKLTGR
jgi:hypothetical protein